MPRRLQEATEPCCHGYRHHLHCSGDNGDSDVHEDGADANLQVPRALSQDGDEHG